MGWRPRWSVKLAANVSRRRRSGISTRMTRCQFVDDFLACVELDGSTYDRIAGCSKPEKCNGANAVIRIYRLDNADPVDCWGSNKAVLESDLSFL